MLRMTRAQVREVDRRSIEQYHIPGVVLMENAARAVADEAMKMLDGTSKRVGIVCGGGNNGGDGLAVARHLHNRGCQVEILLATDAAKYSGDALTNWNIVKAMGIPIGWKSSTDLIVDALFGTGLDKAPRAQSIEVIEKMNNAKIPILSIDLPSGLDCDSGKPLGASCVRAAKTVTFVAEKAGFANPQSRQYTGEVIVGDIGCPRELIDDVARSMP